MPGQNASHSLTFPDLIAYHPIRLTIFILGILALIVGISQYKNILLRLDPLEIRAIDNMDQMLRSKGDIMEKFEDLMLQQAELAWNDQKEAMYTKWAQEARSLIEKKAEILKLLDSYRSNPSKALLNEIFTSSMDYVGASESLISEALHKDQVLQDDFFQAQLDSIRILQDSLRFAYTRDTAFLNGEIARLTLQLENVEELDTFIISELQDSLWLLESQLKALAIKNEELANSDSLKMALLLALPPYLISGGNVDLNLPKDRMNVYQIPTKRRRESAEFKTILQVILFPENNPDFFDTIAGRYSAILQVNYTNQETGTLTSQTFPVVIVPNSTFKESFVLKHSPGQGTLTASILYNPTRCLFRDKLEIGR